MQNDSLADALTRIRNAIAAGHTQTKLRFSKKIYNLTQVLVSEKFVTGTREMWENDQHFILVDLLDLNGNARITHLEVVSRPGRRVYVNKTSIPRVLGGVGIALISTSNGILSSRILQKMNSTSQTNSAGAQPMGGEVLCYVW